MLRLSFILVPLLLIGACVLSIGSTVASFDGSKPRTIEAPRAKVFDALQKEQNFQGFDKVSDTGDRIRYEIPLTEEVLQAMGRGQGTNGPFTGGTLSMILEPDRLMRIELVSRDDKIRLKFNAHFADDPTKTKTIITADTQVTDASMKEEDRKSMERMFNMMSGMIVGGVISGIEKEI